MNEALKRQLEAVERFDATHHRPIRILTEDDAKKAEAARGKRKNGLLKPFDPQRDKFRQGLTFRLWNCYSWQLDITEIMEKMSPGYLARLAGVGPEHSEAIRKRWEEWCKQPENYIPQPRRPHFWDYWQAWVEAGELARFKADLVETISSPAGDTNPPTGKEPL